MKGAKQSFISIIMSRINNRTNKKKRDWMDTNFVVSNNRHFSTLPTQHLTSTSPVLAFTTMTLRATSSRSSYSDILNSLDINDTTTSSWKTEHLLDKSSYKLSQKVSKNSINHLSANVRQRFTIPPDKAMSPLPNRGGKQAQCQKY